MLMQFPYFSRCSTKLHLSVRDRRERSQSPTLERMSWKSSGSFTQATLRLRMQMLDLCLHLPTSIA